MREQPDLIAHAARTALERRRQELRDEQGLAREQAWLRQAELDRIEAGLRELQPS